MKDGMKTTVAKTTWDIVCKADSDAQLVAVFCGDYNNKREAGREGKREALPRRVANNGKAYTYKEFCDFYKKDAPKRWRDAGHEGSVERTVEEHGPPEEYIKQQPEYVKQQQELQRQSWRSSTKRKATGGLLVHEDSWDGRMCPRHRLAGREAGPHPFQSVMVCGCCAGTCELCDPTLNFYD